MSDDTANDGYNHQNHNGSDDEMTDKQHIDALWIIYGNLNKDLHSVHASTIKEKDDASIDVFLDGLRELVDQIPLHI